MTNRKAPESVMRDLCEAVNDWQSSWDGRGSAGAWKDAIGPALAAYRAATAPLRTRASVDAEIAMLVRANAACLSSQSLNRNLIELCSEPTTDDHGSSSTPAAKESRDNAGVSAGPTYSFTTRHGDRIDLGKEPLEDPEPCGCEEGDDLKRQISLVRIHAQRGVGPNVNPRCPGEAACREILLITIP